MDDLISRQAAIEALGMAIDVDDFRTATGLIHEATVSKVLDCIPAADVVPICQTGCKGCEREYNLVVGSCRLCARFYKDMYEGVE